MWNHFHREATCLDAGLLSTGAAGSYLALCADWALPACLEPPLSCLPPKFPRAIRT